MGVLVSAAQFGLLPLLVIAIVVFAGKLALDFATAAGVLVAALTASLAKDQDKRSDARETLVVLTPGRPAKKGISAKKADARSPQPPQQK